MPETLEELLDMTVVALVALILSFTALTVSEPAVSVFPVLFAVVG